MKVGFIGLGIMGLPMATNVAKKYDLVGYDVIKKDTPFPFASSIEELVSKSDVIITMVPKDEHARSVYAEVIKYVSEDKICIDMSTISPACSVELANKLAEVNVKMLDCPVVKSQPAAVAGTLGIYVGGDYNTYLKVKDILACMGSNIIHMGENGKGITMKILHNMLVASIQNGVNEVMTIAKEMKLDIDDVVTAISYGGAQNFYLDTKNQNIKNEVFPTAFSVENMNKDVHFACELANQLNLKLNGIENIKNVYEYAMANALAKQDFSASFTAVKQIAKK